MSDETSSAIFDRCFAVTQGFEGGAALSLDPSDPGNWTGGAQGEGELRGTRWGFSAASYPGLDIANLDQAHAAGLAFAHYWLPMKCPFAPECLALLLFDAAFQHGVADATSMLQRALGILDDGVFGPVTQARLTAVTLPIDRPGPAVRALMTAFQIQRLLHMVDQKSWASDRLGLARRLCRLAAQAEDIFFAT